MTQPNWTGAAMEIAVSVKVTDDELETERSVADQVRRYLAQQTALKPNPVVLAMTVHLVCTSFLGDADTVLLTREVLLATVKTARSRIRGLKEREHA